MIAMRARITDHIVDQLTDDIIWDREVRGFGVRARGHGKVYVLKFREPSGRQRWHTIGQHGSPWTAGVARKEAKRLLGELAGGQPPGQRRPEPTLTVAASIEMFVEAHCQHLRTGKRTAKLLQYHVISRWNDRPLASITHGDIAQLLRAVQGEDRAKRVYIANRTRAALSRFFRWSISEALLPPSQNPVLSTEPRRGEIKRDRVLMDDEIIKLWRAGVAEGYPFGHILRLLLITGQRRSEVGGLRWSELNLDERSWVIPAGRYKSEHDHHVPLSGLALEILVQCPAGHDCAFSSHEQGFSGWSKAKARLPGLSSPWRLHDIRRTVATKQQAIGIAPHVIAALLGHAPAQLFGITAVYLRDNQTREKRAAMERWSQHLERLVKS